MGKEPSCIANQQESVGRTVKYKVSLCLSCFSLSSPCVLCMRELFQSSYSLISSAFDIFSHYDSSIDCFMQKWHVCVSLIVYPYFLLPLIVWASLSYFFFKDVIIVFCFLQSTVYFSDRALPTCLRSASAGLFSCAKSAPSHLLVCAMVGGYRWFSVLPKKDFESCCSCFLLIWE